MPDKKEKQFALVDMEFDEISAAFIPINTHAEVVLFKSERVETPTITRHPSAGRLALAKARSTISKYNKNHSSKTGEFTSGPGGGGSGKASSGGSGKPKSAAAKQKDIDGLSDAEYTRYTKAPKSMSHDEAMAHAKLSGTAARNAASKHMNEQAQAGQAKRMAAQSAKNEAAAKKAPTKEAVRDMDAQLGRGEFSAAARAKRTAKIESDIDKLAAQVGGDRGVAARQIGVKARRAYITAQGRLERGRKFGSSKEDQAKQRDIMHDARMRMEHVARLYPNSTNNPTAARSLTGGTAPAPRRGGARTLADRVAARQRAIENLRAMGGNTRHIG